jgi:hypothetical protein
VIDGIVIDPKSKVQAGPDAVILPPPAGVANASK